MSKKAAGLPFLFWPGGRIKVGVNPASGYSSRVSIKCTDNQTRLAELNARKCYVFRHLRYTTAMTSDHPVLYSFRRCPYAIRARLAIACSGLPVELREVVLKDKPAAMLQASPKATVPVLVLSASAEKKARVIDESRDIMRWALRQSDPDNWLCRDNPDLLWQVEGLIQENDFVFKQHLDRYKYFERHPNHPQNYYREQCEVTLIKLERLLQQHNFLTGDHCSLADIAIFPFIRQFAHVDRDWFYAAPYPCLQRWLDHHLQSQLFIGVMKKYPQWKEGAEAQLFPETTHGNRG